MIYCDREERKKGALFYERERANWLTSGRTEVEAEVSIRTRDSSSSMEIPVVAPKPGRVITRSELKSQLGHDQVNPMNFNLLLCNCEYLLLPISKFIANTRTATLTSIFTPSTANVCFLFGFLDHMYMCSLSLYQDTEYKLSDCKSYLLS